MTTWTQTAPPPPPSSEAPEGESDTLEARAKLTSYSALNLGGLPRHSTPIITSKGLVTLAGLNSRLEAVSGA